MAFGDGGGGGEITPSQDSEVECLGEWTPEHGSLKQLDVERRKLKAQMSRLQERLEALDQRRSILMQEEDQRQSRLDLERYGGLDSPRSRSVIGSPHFDFERSPSPVKLAQAQLKAKTKVPPSLPHFPWTDQLKALAKSVFNISSFRFPQEGIMNGVMDQRDVVVIMPTGGGKSLCYQLPALLTDGLTLVISPLVSLIQDQVWHLNEIGVKARLITGASSQAALKEVLAAVANGGQDQTKLVYVTPERIAKSKQFMSALEKAVALHRLSRIVIDEAHCCSELGHDFRPDYKRLSVLRTVFPSVPIIALTATCPPSVLKDMLQILKLSKMGASGTLLFTAPLYRPNLRYSVVPKPAGMQACLQAMAQWIERNHKDSSGIIYCLSKKETRCVALFDWAFRWLIL